MLNRYETVFILTPVLSEDQAKEAVKEYQDLLKAEGAKMVHQENWGLRKLAYPIQKKSTGFYHLFEYDAPGNIIAKVELMMKRDERVLRFLTTSLDKWAIQWAEKKRKRAADAKKGKVEETTNAD